MKTIILIEDDTVLRENTAELLELSNYKVKTANDGKEGLELIKRIVPDIIICDIMMPELNGYEVLEALSKDKKTRNIPFIFLSAKTDHSEVRRGMDLGADDYITKPFSEDELLSAIRSRLAKAEILSDTRKNKKHRTEENSSNQIKTLNDLKNFFDDTGFEVHVSKDENLFNERDHANLIYLITKGLVKCYKLDEQGKELTTAIYKADDLLGYTALGDSNFHTETARAIKDTDLVALGISEFKEILEQNHHAALVIIELLTEDLKGTEDQLLQMAYSSVNKKTADTILKFAEKMNSNPNKPFKISRNDLASVAGIATETLIRALTNFKKEGIIKSEGRNIKILDLQRLKEIN